MKYKWFLILIVLTVSSIIILENRTMVGASLMSYQVNINLAIMLLFALVLGVFTGLLLGTGKTESHRRRPRQGDASGAKIYIGNLAENTTDADLEQTFSSYGVVKSVNIIKDRDTGLSRGFGFIEMGDRASGDAAIAALNNTVLLGQTINVNRAHARRYRKRRQSGTKSNRIQ